MVKDYLLFLQCLFHILTDFRFGWMCKWTGKHKLSRFLIMDVEPWDPWFYQKYYSSGRMCMRCGRVLWDDGVWTDTQWRQREQPIDWSNPNG